ncbi:MAG: 2TM domain-containing protein [Marinirhabdus sp.]
MEPLNTERENKYLRAKERVQNVKKFYTSLTSYVIIISLLAGLNYYINEFRYAWFLWAAFGWGIGLVFQAAKAFGWSPFMNKDWEARKLKQFMEEEERNNRYT